MCCPQTSDPFVRCHIATGLCDSPQDPGFRTEAAQRFLQLRAGNWSDAAVGGLLDSQEAKLRTAGIRTLTKYDTDSDMKNYPSGVLRLCAQSAA